MIALPVMAIAACSSNKNASNDQSGEGMMGAGTGMDANGNATCLLKSRRVFRCGSCSRTTSFTSIWIKYDIRSDFAAMLDARG